MGISYRLARFIAETSYEDIPEAVLRLSQPGTGGRKAAGTDVQDDPQDGGCGGYPGADGSFVGRVCPVNRNEQTRQAAARGDSGLSPKRRNV